MRPRPPPSVPAECLAGMVAACVKSPSLLPVRLARTAFIECDISVLGKSSSSYLLRRYYLPVRYVTIKLAAFYFKILAFSETLGNIVPGCVGC